MPGPPEPKTPSTAVPCAECRAALASDQRYCLQCGARQGPLSPLIMRLIGLAPAPDRTTRTGGVESAAPRDRLSLSPSLAAGAVMSLLAFGVLVGSAASPAADSNAGSRVVVAVSPPAAPAPEASAPAALPAQPAPAEPAVPSLQSAPAAPAGATTTQGRPKAQAPAAPAPNPFALPPIRHVFLVVLSDQGYAAAFGPGSPAPYLAKTLTRQGELLPNYYAVASGELANAIALLSGQGPTAQTAADCPQYVDLAPGTIGPGGQLLGNGCLYPSETQTLADELTAKGKSWKAYVEGSGSGAAGEARTCRHAALGSPDPNQAARPGDAQVTWRNPFVYFHSVIDTPSCAKNDVGLDKLKGDLKLATRTPSFAYIVPDRCHDGSEQPCAPGLPAGLAAADAFLRTLIPQIESSSAYKDHGLIAITFDQAPQSGLNADSSACCDAPQYPNLTASPGSTGSAAGATSSAASPSGTSPGATPASPATAGTTSPSTTPSATTPSASVPAAAGPTTPTGGGGQVGLLLISRYVQAGSTNPTDYLNHFSLLRGIEDMFGLEHLGYATDPALPTLDKSVFNARSTAAKR